MQQSISGDSIDQNCFHKIFQPPSAYLTQTINQAQPETFSIKLPPNLPPVNISPTTSPSTVTCMICTLLLQTKQDFCRYFPAFAGGSYPNYHISITFYYPISSLFLYIHTHVSHSSILGSGRCQLVLDYPVPRDKVTDCHRVP